VNLRHTTLGPRACNALADYLGVHTVAELREALASYSNPLWELMRLPNVGAKTATDIMTLLKGDLTQCVTT
jgi:Holliday junction resolvasome RuvABC DNA-binding subunit